MKVVRCPSRSQVKLDAIRGALRLAWPDEDFDLLSLPVELQARPGMQIKAEPIGEEETKAYARERRRELCREHGTVSWLDIAIESGAINELDVAVVALYPERGKEEIVLSEGVPFPAGMLEAARERGFKTTTVGDIIHEKWRHIPSDNWQAHFPPYLSREAQIREAVVRGLRQIEAR